jgi:DME family drug/metabolite transporter
MSTSGARLAIIVTALLFSTGGAAIKACDLSGWVVAGLRSGIAALTILVYFRNCWRPGNWQTLALALAYAGVLVFFTLATKLTTAANAIFLQSTAPLYMILLGPALIGEKPQRGDWPLFLAIALGMGMFFIGQPPTQVSAPNPFLGNIFGLAAGACWAATLMGLRARGRGGMGQGAQTVVFWGNVIAFLVAAPFYSSLSLGVSDIWVLLYLGVLQIGLAYILLTLAFAHVPALEASMLLFLEPVLNPVWTWVLHGEQPGAWAIAGGVLILGATVTRTLWAGAQRRVSR